MLFYGTRSLKQRPFNSICISMIKTANALLKAKDTVTMKRGYDRLAKQWVLKGDDGSSVALQAYWALFWIDDSKVYRYQFTVTHSPTSQDWIPYRYL